MSVEVWGLMTKSAEDSTKIEEEIDDRIATHNTDPDSHGLADMALYAHRTGDVLDHIEAAVKGYHLDVPAKVAETIVAPVDGDYTTIQDALAAGKKRIYVKAGTYIIPSPGFTIVTDEVEIRGEDKDHVILKAEGILDPNFYMVFLLGDIKDIVIRSVTFDANKSEQSGAAPRVGCIYSDGQLEDITIQDCKIVNNLNEYGIWFNNATARNIRILDNFFSGSVGSEACLLWGVGNIISRNVFKNGVSSLRCNGYQNVISNNLVEINTWGIAVAGNENMVIGNMCRLNSKAGISIFEGANHTIIGNVCRENGVVGNIAGIDISASILSVVIVGNISTYNYGPGLRIYRGSNHLVQGNSFTLNRQEGIKIEGAQYLTISGNTLRYNSYQNSGVYSTILLISSSTYYPKYNSISNNAIYAEWSPYGIRENDVNCDYNVIIGNVVRGAKTAQISIQGVNDDMGHNIA